MLRGPTFPLILSVVFLAEPTQSIFKYMAQCNYDATNGFSSTVVVKKGASDTVHQIVSLSSSKTTNEACTIPKVDETEYTITMTVDNTGNYFNPWTCASVFQVIDTNSDYIIDEITFTFLIQTLSGFVSNTDVIFSWKCTTADHNNVVTETVSVTSLQENSLGLKSQLALEVYDTTNTKIASGTELTLGGMYYLKLKHTYANSKNSEVGIYVRKLTFYEGTDSISAPNVVAISDGCKQISTAYELSSNFVKEVATSSLPVGGGLAAGGADGVYVIASGTFQTVLWMKSTGISTSLKVEAVVVQCISSDQSKCEDHQGNVCNAGRRRRSAEDTGLKNVTSVATSFTISLVGGSANQGSEQKDVNGRMTTCYQTYTFWILVLVFGILIMLCLIFAIYLFFRLRREKESRRKTEEKYSAINLALNETKSSLYIIE